MANTVSRNQRDMILKWHRDGYSEFETAQLLKLPVLLVRAVIDGGEKKPEPEPAEDDAGDTPQESLF